MPRLILAMLLAAAGLVGAVSASPFRASPPTDLDALMQKVLARRDENWKKLQQYIIEEAEKIDVRGPVNTPIWGERRDYSWFIRDGFFIRSPVKVNGVTISEADRRKEEDRYFEMAKRRDKQRGRGAGRGAETPAAAPETPDVQSLIGQTRQPEFMDSAYFLKFKFEQGKYALVGREKFDGLDVLKIEYYPAHLFSHEQDKDQRQKQAGRETRDQSVSAAMEQMMNKISLVTLWVEPNAHQIVKYTFDNVNVDFLPAAWLVRVKDLKASMTMSQPFKDVWLPRDVDMFFAAAFAAGSFDVRYHLDYHDYKEAKGSGRIKDPGGK